MNPLTIVDKYLNKITMYRLLAYGLSAIALIAIGFGFAGQIGLSGGSLLLSFATLIIVGFGTNSLLGRFWPAVTNFESFYISALILGFILPPPTSLTHWLAIVLAAVIAMASKFLLAPYKKHIFNPAAFAALVLGLAAILPATWWIGNPTLLPVTAIFGLLVLRKLRLFSLFSGFLVLSLAVTAMVSMNQNVAVLDALKSAFTSSPLIFLGTVMLTEPLTMPPRRQQQVIYGAIVGAIFASQLSFGRVTATPELALILGNIFSFAVSPKYKIQLRLAHIKQLSKHIYDIAFTPERPLSFSPGQYLEWTLPGVELDSRGNRRTFSIASSPGEKQVHIGIKTTDQLRGFKKALLAMQPDDVIMAGQLGGDFIMPSDVNKKLVFIAGGIGVTPFRSMLQHLIDMNQKRDIVLFYLVSDPVEISYTDVLRAAEKQGVKTIPVLSTSGGNKIPADWKYPTGYITKELLHETVPDYAERSFYLSGPNAMVQSYKRLLVSLGLKRRQIISDYFSGY